MNKLTYLGHSAFLLETQNFSALFDPFLVSSPVKAKDFKNLDAIFVTHGHGDHFGDTLQIAQNTGATVYTSLELASWLSKKGVHAIGMQFGVAKFDFGTLRMTSAKHSNSFSVESGIPCGESCGFVLSIDNKKIYHAGDTSLIADMMLLESERIDVACLPIGGYYTMDVNDAVRAVSFIKPVIAVPMHYNTFAQITQAPNEFVKLVKDANLDTEVKVLNFGESFTF
ncbi:MAG: metal-dependent hydrolase [Synergistaceae bacterium]|nr:metal-dependent hydrolase [Synergistaceae bacterium]